MGQRFTLSVGQPGRFRNNEESRMRVSSRLLHAERTGRLEERARIARELHDTLLPSAEGLSLMCQSFARLLAEDDPARGTLELALERAAALVRDARVCVLDLRSQQPSNDLTMTIAGEGEFLSRGTLVQFALDVTGTPRRIHPVAETEMCGIMREALINAFKHSHANAINAEIHFGTHCMRLKVTDNGNGIGKAANDEAQYPTHFGLQGMQERAVRIGVELVIAGSVGTQITCTIPAASAYRRVNVKVARSHPNPQGSLNHLTSGLYEESFVATRGRYRRSQCPDFNTECLMADVGS